MFNLIVFNELQVGSFVREGLMVDFFVFVDSFGVDIELGHGVAGVELLVESFLALNIFQKGLKLHLELLSFVEMCQGLHFGVF